MFGDVKISRRLKFRKPFVNISEPIIELSTVKILQTWQVRFSDSNISSL